VVEEEELRAGLAKKFGLEVDDGQMATLMEEFDTNKDGVLELKEFQVDLIRGKVEALQRAEKEAVREAKRLALEAERIEKDKQTIMDISGRRTPTTTSARASFRACRISCRSSTPRPTASSS